MYVCNQKEDRQYKNQEKTNRQAHRKRKIQQKRESRETVNKRNKIPKGQSETQNPEKL